MSKATVQTYGLILNTLLDQIIPLSDDVWYWDEVLSSYTYSSLYTIQTSPLRLWALTKDVYHETKDRIRHPPEDIVGSTTTGLSQQWRQFYSIVRDSVRERSISNIQQKVLSPIALARTEARQKQANLRRLREITASGLGILVDEGLDFSEAEEQAAGAEDKDGWKAIVERSVALMDVVLKDVRSVDAKVADFEDKVFDGVRHDPEFSVLEEVTNTERPRLLAARLMNMLQTRIPNHVDDARLIVRENGRPPFLVRYWLPLAAALLSSTTILRILSNRRAEIVQWITDFGSTVRDFWFNWVIEPVNKIIRTIRHDDNSEIAIMSRDSLKADRESLERMVVDFALDKPHFAVGSGSSLSEAQIADIRAKVSEGDVTPVLRAYEKDLRKPFMGAVRGDLVRSLLIQVQKTKVDLEVAISGIDSLLKSQELVFGFVGLTPGILVSVGIVQYLRGVLGGRRGGRASRTASDGVRVLRNIDKIFANAAPQGAQGLLSYKDHGLLLCEVHVLRSLAHRLLPRDIEKEFLEDLDEMANMKRGVQWQVKAFERIRWAYAKWLK